MKFVILATCLFLIVGCGSESVKEIAAIKITHPAGYQVTSEDVRKIIKLARAVGMKQVTAIAPLGGQSPRRSLIVTGPEIVTGRKISQDELQIDDWLSIPVPNPQEGELMAMLRPGLSYCKRESATFTVNGQPRRVACRETDLTEADKVFTALTAGNVEFVGDGVRERGFSFAEPSEISVTPERVFISFLTGDRSCSIFVKGKLIGEKFQITYSGMVCA